MKRSLAEARMQNILDRLGIPLKVAWTPNPSHNKHGLIEAHSKTLFIFDVKEEDAWQTFTHEILEWKLKALLKVYRDVINGLIEIVEKTCYTKKEEFLEFLPQVFRMVEEEKKHEQN